MYQIKMGMILKLTNIVTYVELVESGIHNTGHENERNTDEKGPEPAEFNEVDIEYVVLLGKVHVVTDEIEVTD